MHGLEFSRGAIAGVIHRAAEAARRSVDEILERVRGSPVVFADEKGWRQDGLNGFAWTFSTPAERCFLRHNRGGAVVDEALVEEFGGVLVSDSYGAYSHYAGL